MTMVYFTLASAVKMVLRSDQDVTVEPADGTLSGARFTRPDGTVLVLLQRQEYGDHMRATVTLPDGAAGEPIDGLFGTVQAHDLVADYLAGHAMVYDQVHYPDDVVGALGQE